MIISMSSLAKGSLAKIKMLDLNHELSKKLFDLGLRPEARIQVVQKNHDLVVKINEMKLALSNNFCRNIMVELIAS